jgi:hypothetical protein
MKAPRRLTEVEFRRTLSAFKNDRSKGRGRPTAPRTLKIAHQVLVAGRSAAEVARVFGVSRQQASAVAVAFFGVFLVSNGFPPTWERRIICAPPVKLERFLKKVEKARQAYWDEQ